MSTTRQTFGSHEVCRIEDCGAPVFIKRHQLCRLHYNRFSKRKQRTGKFDTATKVKQGRPRIEYSPESVRKALSGQKGAWNQTQSVCNGEVFTYKQKAFKAQRVYSYDYHSLRWGENTPLPDRPRNDPQRRAELRSNQAGMTYKPSIGGPDPTNSTLGGLHPAFRTR
jgi:hypothetical protein